MLRMFALCQIGGRSYAPVSVQLSSAWSETIATATVELPRIVEYRTREVAAVNLIERGQPVRIELGYNTTVTHTFTGYVSERTEAETLTVVCQDAGFFLDSYTVTAFSEKASLAWAVQKMQANKAWPYRKTVQHVQVSLGKLRFVQATPLQILDRLKSEYGIEAWSRKGTLHLGAAIVPSLAREIPIDFARHVLDESELQREGGNRPVRVKVTSFANNVKYEFTAGPSFGEERAVFRYGLDFAACKALAEAEAKRVPQPGYAGTIKLLGFPGVQHGDTLALADPRDNPKNTRLVIRQVDTNFNSSEGLTQTCAIFRSF